MARRKNEASQAVAERIGKLYQLLHDRCMSESNLQAFDDMFHDTVLCVVSDISAVSMNDADLITHFVYRFRMISYRSVKNKQQLKEIPYADNIQAKERQG